MAHHNGTEKDKENDEEHKASEDSGEAAGLHVVCLLAIKVEASLVGEGCGSDIQNLLVPREIKLNFPINSLKSLVSRLRLDRQGLISTWEHI